VAHSTGTAPTSGPGPPEAVSPDELRGEQLRSADPVVQVFTLPADGDAVDAMIPTYDGQAAGFTYDRSAG
jgi:hypothetical protein